MIEPRSTTKRASGGGNGRSPSPELRLTAAQALVRYLATQFSVSDGVRERIIPAAFGIFGHGNVTGIGQALEEAGHAMPYLQARNEQSMVHAAIGYAKAKRRLSTLLCTSSVGPGATNMITGAATATINRIPVLLVPGDIYASGRQGNVLQQLEHSAARDVSVNDCFRPVARFFDRITRPEQLLASLPEAVRILMDPVETGSVVISLPQDVGPEAWTYPESFFEQRDWLQERRTPDMSAIGVVAMLLRAAERPLIIAGGGVFYSDASDDVRAMSEEFGIPVAETFAGKGSIRESTPLLLGGIGVEGSPAANAIAAKADLVLCVGTRMSDFITASRSLFQHQDVRFVGINITPHDAFKLGSVAVVADAREAIRALTLRARAEGVAPRPEHAHEVERVRAAWEDRLRLEVFSETPEHEMTQGQVIGILNAHARAGDVVVAAAGGPPGDLLRTWDATGDRWCHIEFGNSCMGHEIPGGLGVRMARPEGEVYVYVGDGSYLMNPSDLVTAAQVGLKVTVVLVDNGGYQVIRRLQLNTTGRPFGNELRAMADESGRFDGPYLDIDFAQHAQSMGARVWQPRTSTGLRQALEEARAETGCCVIVVKVDRDTFLPPSGAWWDAAPPEVSTSPETALLRAEYERDRAQSRFYG